MTVESERVDRCAPAERASNSSVTDGIANTASGPWASVSGGNSRSAPGFDDWAAGALFQGS